MTRLLTTLTAVLALSLTACRGAVPEAPPDATPIERHYQTTRQAIAEACVAVCAWSDVCDMPEAENGPEQCEAWCEARACAWPCTERSCVRQGCETPPSGTDEEIVACLDDLWSRAGDSPDCREGGAACVHVFTP